VLDSTESVTQRASSLIPYFARALKSDKGKRRVLFIVPSLIGGGAERVIVHLVNNLDRERYAPMLALGRVDGPYLKELREDVLVHDLGAERARRAIGAVVKAVRTLRPDVVVSTLGLNFAVALAKPFFPRGTRVILREGSSPTAFLKEVEQGSRARAHIYRSMYRVLYSMADKVVCQSDYMLNDLATNMGLHRSKMERVYNPVDFEKIRARTEGAESPYTGQGPHLVTVGNMTYAKACDVLLEAFRLVREKLPRATLTFVGDGENRQSLEDLTARLGLIDGVRFVGFQSNPFVYVKHADLFVSSSRYEGFSNVILEALACGTPVVATDCPSGNREVIKEGVNGWLAKPEDAGSLAETICRAIEERSRLSRREIQAHCESRFSMEYILGLYQALL
jgi:glycosyltransferase involved in cell wall biosynthesis